MCIQEQQPKKSSEGGLTPTPSLPVESVETGSGVTMGSYNGDTGFTGSAVTEGDTITVSGTFTKQEDANEQLKFPQAEATGYYLPLTLKGTQGQAVKRLSNNKILVFGETGDTNTEMNLILSVKQDSPTIELMVYENRQKALANEGGVKITINCSGCSFN